ncbi:MAG: phage terminase small subunit P27 family [Deltaproteobacteria bacterium]
MGRRGPPPKPTALKKLQGTYRKDRAARNEPEPEKACPERPTGLDRIARERWDFLAPKLHALGVLTLVDGSVLEGFCRHYSRAVQADRAIDKYGMIIDTPFGPKLNPAVRVSRESWTVLNQLGSKLGLSPSDRARLSVPEKAPVDDTEEDLFGGGLRVMKGGAHG